jgi:hypothetical protein
VPDEMRRVARSPDERPASMKWGRLLLAAVLVAVVLFCIAILFHALPGGDAALLYVVPPACLGLTLFFGYWVAREARSLSSAAERSAGFSGMVRVTGFALFLQSAVESG